MSIGIWSAAEIVRGYVCLAGHHLLSSFFAIAQGGSSIQVPLVGQAQADSGILHAGNLTHGGGALHQQLAECCRVAIGRVIQ